MIITLDIKADPLQVYARLRPCYDEGFCLYRWGGEPFSYLGFAPGKILSQWEAQRDFPKIIREHLQDYQKPKYFAWEGGWMGLVSYEAGLALDDIRATPGGERKIPDLRMGFYSWILIYDHQKEKWFLASCMQDAVEEGGAELARRLPEMLAANCAVGENLKPLWRCQSARTSVQAKEYAKWVRRIRQYIVAGDIFQANLAHALELQFDPAPGDAVLFQGMVDHNPSPYAACWHTPEFSVVSNSPEQLLRVRGRTVRTRPIAGTRPREEGRKRDQWQSRSLLRSPKERAEHTMLVDLERNDLGRVCCYGSVQVPEFMAREPYRNVHHIVSTVEGELAHGKDGLDALVATFPGGTITGAPKIRAMQIIAELEASVRGAYTGSLFWCAPGGNLEASILIRTLQYFPKGNKAQGLLHVGAGIVADSKPAREWNETLHKARAWLEHVRPEESHGMDLAKQ